MPGAADRLSLPGFYIMDLISSLSYSALRAGLIR